jgi:hypothetical protein
MNSILKLVLVAATLLLLVDYDGRTDQEIKAERIASYISRKDSRNNKDIIFTPQDPERHVDPFMRQGLSNRDIRYSNPPRGWEEMRRQRDVECSENTLWIKESTKKYSPDSWYLLMSYDALPESSSAPLLNGGIATSKKTIETFRYLRGRTKIDLLASMETNIHEIAHGYFDQNVYHYLLDNKIDYNPGNANGFIYISPHQGYYVSFPQKALFPSAELASVIPDKLRTYRYETYIDGTTSTQNDGVIGLLNELQAYYCGSRYCFNMLEPYKTAAGSDATGLFEWVTHTQSSMSAFYEFDFFISEYLLYMKRKYTDNYDKLRSDQAFSESYVALITLYNDLINRYLDRIKKEMDLLNTSGQAEARLTDGWLWIKSGHSHISSGTPLFSDERKTLLPILEGRRYREIRDDFGM